VKEVKPVTIATYQILTAKRKGEYAHLALLDVLEWGLVVYDEVHLLPAPVFKLTAELQARRRLGLTATLVREDGREGDVFSLIGPNRYDAPWKDIESQGWIAPADCMEVRVTLTDAERMAYATAEPDERYRMAATARTKLPVIKALVDRHAGDQVLVIGGFLDQLHQLGEYLDAPIVEGSTTNKQRERLFDEFRSGTVKTLVISKVGNFSIDLPEATVRSRCRAASAPGRRRRSGSGGYCDRRPTAGRRTSTRWSHGTPSTPSTPRTGSGSWPSRATRTPSWMPTTCCRPDGAEPDGCGAAVTRP